MDRYRVQVDKVLIDDDGDFNYESVVDLTAERGQLARFASAVVAEALGASAASVTVEATYAADDEPERGEMTPDGPVVFDDKPKRRRRTKAEMEADRLAELGTANAAAANAMPQPQAVTPPVQVAPVNDTQAEQPPADWNPFG